MITVKFSYKQVLQTIHPRIEMIAHFYGVATVDEKENVVLFSVIFSAESPFGQTPGEEIHLPNESTHAGAMFAGLLREAARNEAHRIQKQAVREAAQKQGQ